MLTAKMLEIIEWWDEYLVEKWEDDIKTILFEELIYKIERLDNREEEGCLVNYLLESGRLKEYREYFKIVGSPKEE